jgi:pimeloyl-ACP methyl ester carboxylesterase
MRFSLKDFVNGIERAIGSPRRNIAIALVLIALGMIAVMVGNSRQAQLKVEQAYRDGLNAAIQGSVQVLGAVFGEDGLGSVEPSALGLRVYVPGAGGEGRWADIEGELGDRVVVLVHGLDEPGGIWDDLAPALAGEGHVVVRFEYPNDQAIALSGASLLGGFGELSERGVERLDLVCHSMGGLVARDALTRDGFGKTGLGVEHLVTIGTPHGGSPWARLRAVAEIREHAQRWVESEDMDPKRLLGFARDGVGQAGRDLLPGSDFLVDLDTRSLPEGIEVTCIVGRLTTAQGMETGKLLAAGTLRDVVGADDASAIMGAIDRLGREFGDGVVPMSSAVLDGVSDVVILEANHRSMVRRVELGEMIRQGVGMGASAEPPAIEVVLEWLKEE